MLATELYAISQGTKCEGPDECHWCAAPCKRHWIFDDPELITKLPTKPKRPNNSYICMGCWLFRRKRLTIHYLKEGFKDGQAPVNHSWIITQTDARTLRKKDAAYIYEILLAPPSPFVLCLSDGITNHLHTAFCNEFAALPKGTPLHYTLNNIPQVYTIYELEEACKYGDEGKLPGVRLLLEFFGKPPKGLVEPDKAPSAQGGRKPAPNSPRKTVDRLLDLDSA